MVATGTSPAQSGPLEKLKEFRRDMSPTQWLQTKLMFASILLLHVIGFGVFILFVVPGHYKGPGHRGVGPRLHARAPSRLRRRPHLGHRQHHPQADERGEEAAQRGLLLLPRPLDAS